MAKGVKTGGRQKGTPNKDNPLKGYIRAHSLKYFEPDPKTGESEFEKDMNGLDAIDRISAELRLLEFHQPKMKAVDVEMSVDTDNALSLAKRLDELAGMGCG